MLVDCLLPPALGVYNYMLIFIPLLVFTLGLLVGSFLNVVILRLNTGRSVVTGRSACARCNHTLRWYELIPVFSFIGLRGKCRTCRRDISVQYPIVELVTAIVFVLLYTKFLIGGLSMYALISWGFAATVASLLIVITVYDLRHKIIPDTVVYPLILLAFASIIWSAVQDPLFLPWGRILEGTIVTLPFFALWYFSKGRAMGFGDVKLALAIGWLVGLVQGFTAVLLAFWIGAIVGLLLIGISRRYGMKSEIAFGPFLIIGLCIVVLWGVTIQSLFPVWH